MKRISSLISVMALLLFSVLAVSAKEAKPTEKVVVDTSTAAISDMDTDYKINAFDLLEISVYQEPDLFKSVRVSQDGFISFPLIGKVKLSGLNVMEAQEVITAKLAKDYLVDPSVTIFIKEYSAKKVLVIGEVKSPGSYNIPQDVELTVLEAIGQAGGFSPNANMDGTKIIRMENGVKKYIAVTITDIIKHGDKTKDVPLKPGDVVFVPERIF
jgi:polysaccharide export outer membrane protein